MIVDFKSLVGQSLGKKGYVSPRVGLELEYEKCKPVIETGLSNKWYTEIDHSLRAGGLEFISVPLKPLDMAPAVRNMLVAANKMKAKVTLRCGLHVHVNVTHMTWAQLFQFTTYYTLLEPYLFNEFAPGRETSHFCVPTWTNTALTEYMYNDGQLLRQGIRIPETKRGNNWAKAAMHLGGAGGHRSKLIMMNTPKYAALNMSALKKFGTLEFRQAPSSLDATFILKWARLLLRIQQRSMTYGDAMEIVEEYDKSGILTLCEKVGFYPAGLVDELDQEDAADAATIMAGHVPVNWKQLEWEVK
jgi:hypothetical protein